MAKKKKKAKKKTPKALVVPKKTGRKLLNIDEKVLAKFADLGATNVEMAEFFGCDEGTIRKRFSELLAKARAHRKVKLREMQWASAANGSVAMQIWLGKQYLGQVERQTIETSGESTFKLQYSVNDKK